MNINRIQNEKWVSTTVMDRHRLKFH